jgi:hypothetical protein
MSIDERLAKLLATLKAAAEKRMDLLKAIHEDIRGAVVRLSNIAGAHGRRP